MTGEDQQNPTDGGGDGQCRGYSGSLLDGGSPG
jgi:hypothetical protein